MRYQERIPTRRSKLGVPQPKQEAKQGTSKQEHEATEDNTYWKSNEGQGRKERPKMDM